MIEVSELAAAALLESLRASGVGPEKGLRLAVQEGMFALRLDSPTADDHVIRFGEAAVVIVSKDIEDKYGEALIDVEEGPCGNRLTLRTSGT
ncbi:MAG: hypothetical protein HYX92_01085 [Chloroflexi bacterium]|nr:hypothetical protein [Chloroflexota bacterium]